MFFTTGEVGLTFARRLAGGGGVVGADLALADLSAGLARQRVTDNTRIAIFDPSARVVALSTPEMGSRCGRAQSDETVTMPRLGRPRRPGLPGAGAKPSAVRLGERFTIESAGPDLARLGVGGADPARLGHFSRDDDPA